MSIYLGNLSVEQMQSRARVEFPVELVEYLNERRQENAGRLARDTWHCFDIPFVLVCENMEMAQKVYDQLKDKSEKFEEALQISVQSEE